MKSWSAAKIETSRKEKKTCVNLAKMHEKADETRDIVISDCRLITFTKELTCIGFMMLLLLGDTEEVKTRIKKESKAMGALNFTWNAEDVQIETKIKLCTCASLNLKL